MGRDAADDDVAPPQPELALRRDPLQQGTVLIRLLGGQRDAPRARRDAKPRQRVTAWTWELELKPTRKDAKVRPLFTFETVAGPANNP